MLRCTIELGMEAGLAARRRDQQPALIFKHGPCGYSLLHLAATYGDPAMVGLLLSYGLDPDEARNSQRYMPLFFAYPPPYAKAELLLARGQTFRRAQKTILPFCIMLSG
jgi:hypothetical protein